MALVTNKNSFKNYEIIETYEAGMVLSGTEVKSISHSQASINEAYIIEDKGELFVINMHVSPFEQGNQFNVDPYRNRKLLLHKQQIRKLLFQSQKAGLTIIPTKIYWHNQKLKMEIALARGKKLYDKREDMKKRDSSREMNRY